jgi:hypothetical protein
VQVRADLLKLEIVSRNQHRRAANLLHGNLRMEPLQREEPTQHPYPQGGV